jgi:hypothetical protein
MGRLIVFASILALTGCQSFKMGMACYVPHGQYGTCSVGPTPDKPDTTPK